MVVLYILCIMFICIYPWPVADAERYGDHLEVITVSRHTVLERASSTDSNRTLTTTIRFRVAVQCTTDALICGS